MLVIRNRSAFIATIYEGYFSLQKNILILIEIRKIIISYLAYDYFL